MTVTGKELLQSQGRARQRGAEYVSIVDRASDDPRMDRRSRVQAANQSRALGALVRRGAAVQLPA